MTTSIDVINENNYNRIVAYQSETVPREGEIFCFHDSQPDRPTVVYDFKITRIINHVHRNHFDTAFYGVTVYVRPL